MLTAMKQVIFMNFFCMTYFTTTHDSTSVWYHVYITSLSDKILECVIVACSLLRQSMLLDNNEFVCTENPHYLWEPLSNFTQFESNILQFYESTRFNYIF